MPHVPQFVVVFRSVQAPLQHPWPTAQALAQAPQSVTVFKGVQIPPQQPWPAAQAVPQVPQFVVVLRSVHTPLQQPWPTAQALPQAPQLRTVFKGAQKPPQQPSPGRQATPQAPQFCVVLRGVHVPMAGTGPEQHPWPAGQHEGTPAVLMHKVCGLLHCDKPGLFAKLLLQVPRSGPGGKSMLQSCAASLFPPPGSATAASKRLGKTDATSAPPRASPAFKVARRDMPSARATDSSRNRRWTSPESVGPGPTGTAIVDSPYATNAELANGYHIMLRSDMLVKAFEKTAAKN